MVTKAKNKVAIVLINFNNHSDTIDCVQSIKESKGVDLPFIVVVDNNSNKKEISDHLSFYPYLKVIYNVVNEGFGKANNIGIEWIKRNTDSEFILILNNDTILTDDTIASLLTSFPEDQNIVMLSPKILTYDTDPKIWYAGGFFNFSKMSANICNIGEPDSMLETRQVDFASGCAMLFRSTYFNNYDGFDSGIFMYDEDVELCLRIKKNNQQILFTNNSKLYHKCQGSQNSGENKAKLNQLDPRHPGIRFYLSNTIANRYYILDKHFTGFSRLIIKFKLTLYWILKALQYFLKGEIRISVFTMSKLLCA